jgi:hypothetical protein
MVYSDSSGKLGIVQDIDFICGTDDTSYPVAQKTRNVNAWYQKVSMDILKSSGAWQFDDSNFTDLPVSTTTLVNGQADYSVPTTAFAIKMVEVLNNSGDYIRLTQIDYDDVTGAMSELEETDGVPKYYDLVGNSIILYPAPATGSVTMALGLKVYYDRELDAFTAADTTQEPGFAEPFHRLLSMGASYDFLLSTENYNKIKSLRDEIEQLRKEMKDYYGGRNKERKMRITINRTNYN